MSSSICRSRRSRRRPALLATASLVALAVVLVSGACAGSNGAPDPAAVAAVAEPEGDVTAFVDVTVVPMTGEPGREQALAGQTVLVRGDRIVELGPAGEVPVPAGARLVKGRGRVLIPGLVDMHVHLPPDEGAVGDGSWRTLQLLLAHGVTTARSLAGHPSHPAIRERVAAGELPGPTLYVAAPALHMNSAKTPEEAREAVRRAETDGFDLIKSHHLVDPEVYAAVQEEAAATGLPVAGHVANQIGLERAMAAGMQIEHLDGFLAALLPPDSPAVQGAGLWGQIPPAPILDVVDRERLPALAREMAAQGVWNTPTLALFEKITDTEADVAELRALPAMRWVSAAALDQWAAQREQMGGAFAELGEPFRQIRREIVAALHEAGAPLLAGSDTSQLFHLAGPGLHDEIEALTGAGLPPAAALRAATAAPARYFDLQPDHGSATGRPADFGRIAPGLRADLVLLERNPLDDVTATREIDGVMVRGRWLDRTELDRMLGEVERVVSEP